MWPLDARRFAESAIAAGARLAVAGAVRGGRRSSLAWCRDAFLIGMADELERRGISRKVAADMLGLTHRTYGRQLVLARRSLAEGASTDWVRVLHRIKTSPISRNLLAAEFGWIPVRSFGSILKDLEENGWITERSDGTLTPCTKHGARDLDWQEYVRVLALCMPNLDPGDVAADLGVDLTEVEALWDTEEVLSAAVTAVTVWPALVRVLERAHRFVESVLAGDSTRYMGGTWVSGIRIGDRSLLDKLRENARLVRDDLRAFHESKSRPPTEKESLGEWAALFLEVVDFDPDDERLDAEDETS